MEFTDERKLYLLNLICSFFQKEKEKLYEQFYKENSLDQFIDDISCNFLRVHFSQNVCSFSNEVHKYCITLTALKF